MGDPTDTPAHRTHLVDRMSYDETHGRKWLGSVLPHHLDPLRQLINSRPVPHISTSFNTISIASTSFPFSKITGLTRSFP